MMVQAKIIGILMIKVHKSSFFITVFSKRHRKHVEHVCVSTELYTWRNTPELKLENFVVTLVFPQHIFSFSQTSSCVSKTQKKHGTYMYVPFFNWLTVWLLLLLLLFT